MNTTEFLETLGAQLAGQMQEGKAAAHVRYYRDYIGEQIRKGRSEEEVLAELGDPRLIAKTLVDTDPEAGQEIYSSYGDQEYEEAGYGNSDYDRMQHSQVKHRSYKLDLTTWYGKAIVIIIAAAVIIGVLALIGTLLPVILIICIVVALISWLRRRM